MTIRIGPGDVVRAAGHAGTWTVDGVRQGQAMIEHDGRKIAVPVSTLELLRRGAAPTNSVSESSAPDPTLFDDLD